METCCVSCKKYTANRISSVRKTKQNSLMFFLNRAVCGKKKPTFIKNKNSIKQYLTILKIFEMISLKLMKSLANLY